MVRPNRQNSPSGDLSASVTEDASISARQGSRRDSWSDHASSVLQAIELICTDAPLAEVFNSIAAAIDRVAGGAACAIAMREAADDSMQVIAAPGLPSDWWPVTAAGINATSVASPDGDTSVPSVDGDLLKSATQPLLWCHWLADADGSKAACIALQGLDSSEPPPELRRIVEQFGVAIRVGRERLRHSAANARFDALVANIPGVVYQRRVNPDGRIRYTYISEGSRDLFGVSPHEILTDPNALFGCHGPSYSRGFRERLIEASRTMSMWDVEAEIVSRDGKHKWTHAKARPTRLSDGTVQWDGIILDATRIVTRERALIQQKEAAETASRGMSEFFSKMTHELRTPLNAIIGFSELMAAETLGPLGSDRYAAYCNDILQSGRHLLAIVNDVLDVTKIESGKMSLNEEVTDLLPLLEAVRESIRARADIGQVAVTIDRPVASTCVLADARILRKALENLTSNAVKFTNPGGRVTLFIECTVENITVGVRDTGIGMASEDIPRAMERFTQIDDSLSRRHEGTGLGLYLTRLFANLHQAELLVTSELGKGTVATIRFPAARGLASVAA